MGIQPKIALLIISFRIESPIFAETNKYILTKIPWWAGRYVFGTWKKSGIKELGSELGHLNGILKCNIHSDGQYLTFPTYLGQPQRSLLGSSSKKDCHSITRNTITGQTLAVSAFRICLSFQVKHWLFFFNLLLFFLFVVNFVIHWNEKAIDLHVFPIPIPPPTSLSTRSL